jgi:hypothetical protein
MTHIIGFDTETVLTRTGKELEYKFYSAQFFCPELELNEFVTDVKQLERVFTRTKRGSILLASNAEYDFTVLAKTLDKNKFNFKCLYNKSRFLYGKLERAKHTWHIYDLRNIFTNWSLAKMGKFLRVEKLDKPEYLGQRKPETDLESFYFKKYAMRDAEIGYYAGKWIIRKFGKLRLSLPSIAFHYFNSKYKPSGLYLNVDPIITSKVRLAYKGGRCESWVRGTPDRQIFEYDAVSLYPSVMLENPYPLGIRGLQHKTDVNLSHDGVAFCTVKQDAEIPFLSLKIMCKDNSIKMVFPNGTFQNWFTYPELRYFQQKRLGKILKIEEAYETEGCRFFFKEYIEEFFGLKQADIEHADFWKLGMNSLYGKFAQDTYSPELEITEENIVKQLPQSEKKKVNLQTNVLVAAYITAYSRIKMHKFYRSIGAENLAYTDTDSIHSFKQISNMGKGLGELDFKTHGKGTYVRSKFYILNEMVRCRGMEHVFDANHIRHLIEINDVTIFSKLLLRLRSAYRQHKPFLTEKDTQKHFSLEPDQKRNYRKYLIGKELLDSYTESDAVILHGVS